MAYNRSYYWPQLVISIDFHFRRPLIRPYSDLHILWYLLVQARDFVEWSASKFPFKTYNKISQPLRASRVEREILFQIMFNFTL